MTKITQEDRDAVEKWLQYKPGSFRTFATSLWTLLARCREEAARAERNRILDWLECRPDFICVGEVIEGISNGDHHDRD